MALASLQTLFGYKSWANRELFAVLATLPPQHADALHGCIRMLNHVHVVDCIFRAHLSGEAHAFEATNTQGTPSLPQLAADVAATDAWYEAYVAGADPGLLAQQIDFRFTDGDQGRMSREEILLHVATHGGYHRGNVGQILKSISVAPPRDLYTRFLHQSEPQRRPG